MLPLFFYLREVYTMDYKLIISRDDFLDIMLKKGYDFTDTQVLDGVPFQTQEDAIDTYFQDIFDTIYELIEDYRGRVWTKLFFQDMQHKDLTGDALEYQEALITALWQQAVFVWDNGDSSANANKDDNRLPYSPKAVKTLWDIILRG